MTETMPKSRDNVADEVAIRSIVQRYSDAASRLNAVEVAGAFTEDCEWHSPAIGSFAGVSAVESFFAEMLKGYAAFFSALLSGVVTLDPADADKARGRWFVQETSHQQPSTNLTVWGVYHDEYVRDVGGWLISRRRYDPLLLRSDDATTALPYPNDVPSID